MKVTAGRRIEGSRRQIRQQVGDLLDANFRKGRTVPVYGEGVFVSHLVFGLFEPVTLCGRFAGATSTSPLRTLIGVTCRRCDAVWNEAMDRNEDYFESRIEQRVAELADELDQALGEGGEREAWSRWHELRENRALRDRVAARLDERGVDFPPKEAR